jgi:hypothetical protein
MYVEPYHDFEELWRVGRSFSKVDRRIAGNNPHSVLRTLHWTVRYNAWTVRRHTQTVYAYTRMVRACLLSRVWSTVIRAWLLVVHHEGRGQPPLGWTVRTQARMVRLCVGLWVYPKLVEVVVAQRTSPSTYHKIARFVKAHLEPKNCVWCAQPQYQTIEIRNSIFLKSVFNFPNIFLHAPHSLFHLISPFIYIMLKRLDVVCFTYIGCGRIGSKR